MRVTLEVVLARRERHFEICRLARELKQGTRRGQAALDRVRVRKEVHVVNTGLEREPDDIALMSLDLARLELVVPLLVGEQVYLDDPAAGIGCQVLAETGTARRRCCRRGRLLRAVRRRLLLRGTGSEQKRHCRN